MSWSTRLPTPIVLYDGTKLVTLRDAGSYLADNYSTTLDSVVLAAAAEDLMAAAAKRDAKLLKQADCQVRLFLASRGDAPGSKGRKVTPFDLVKQSIERERARNAATKKRHR